MINPLAHILSCAALTPGLRSILCLDAQPQTLDRVADLLAAMLAVTTGADRVERVRLGPAETDDDLWGMLLPESAGKHEQLRIGWRPGLLAKFRSRPALVVIPDLAQLSLAAARSCITLMDSNLANLERHGQHDDWQTEICWLASCRLDHIGQVSSHLLDRFALRMKANDPISDDRRVQDIMAWLQLSEKLAGKQLDKPVNQELPGQWVDLLRQSMRRWPTAMTDEAMAVLLQYINHSGTSGHRRELTLARLAHAIARLRGSQDVDTTHVSIAAQLTGLEQPQPALLAMPLPDSSTGSDEGSGATPARRKRRKPYPESSATPAQTTESEEAPTQASDTLFTSQLDFSAPSAEVAFPEDKPAAESNYASLRLPLSRYRKTGSAHGAVVGVEAAARFHDLALLATLTQAARFLPVRRKRGIITDGQLRIFPEDLYSYRRAPAPEQMLVLLIDYSCLNAVDWQRAILPDLIWAYTERATISVIQLGAANAKEELRATEVRARSILVPRVQEALDARRGRATPLADGLYLALRTLRNALHQGRDTIRFARLVVISDGRANVPIEASRLRKVLAPVGREGIDDALLAARDLGRLPRVRSQLFSPKPRQYPELPEMLATLLAADLTYLQPLEEEHR